MSYVYIRSEPGLWTVGHRDGGGDWHPESDHGDERKAADRVHYLNGGAPADVKDRQYWTGHRSGYMDAIAVIWDVQREGHPQGSDSADLLDELVADLRARYGKARERATSGLEEIPA